MDAPQSSVRSAEEELRREIAELRQGLAEAQARNHELMETIDAIRLGAVDAIVVSEGDRYRVYTLEGANFPYRALVENIQEGALTLTVDGVILFANAAFAALRGLPLSDLPGTVLADHVVDRDRPRFRRLLAASRDGARRGEMHICSGSGSIPVQISMTPITVNEDTTISVVVTDRRKDYGRLRLQGRMLDSVVDAVTAADPDGTIVYWNEAAERLYGWTSSEMVGRSITATVEPGVAEGEEARRVFAELRAGLSWSGELEVRHRDGHRFPVQATRAPVYDEDGRLIAIIGTSQDISERKASEAALRESEARFRSVLDSSLDALYRLNLATGRYEYVSPAFERVVGRSAGEMLSRVPGETMAWVHPDDLPVVEAARARLAETGTAEVDYRLRDRDGRYRWVSNHLSLIRDESGRPLYRDGVVRDITGQKEAEEALREGAARQGFLLELHDALAPLADPVAVQVAAARVLGDHLGVDRVAYFEVDGGDYVVERDHALSVPHIAGRYPVASFGPRLLAVYRSGTTAVGDDVEADPGLSTDERAGFASIQTRAYIGVPLVKAGAFVAGLAVHMASPRAWTEAEVALVEETAERTWAAVERARAAEALRASEEALQRSAERTESDRQRLETIMETIPSAVVLVEAADGRFSYMNRRALDLYGRSYVGLDLDGHVAYVRALRLDGTPYPLEEMPVARSLATGEAVRDAEMVIERADGLRIPVAVSSAPIRDAAGTITTVVVTFDDITERTRAEAERERLLAEVGLERNRLQTILDSLPVGVWITDAAGKMLKVNEIAAEIFGGEAPVADGADEYDVYRVWRADTGERVAASEMPLARALTGETVTDEVLDFERFDGTRGTQLTSASPIRDADGTLIGCVAIVMDITGLRETEAALRSAADRQGLLAEVAARLLSADEPQAVVDDLCRRALDVLDCDVFFNYLADAETGRLRLNACGGIPVDEAERIRHLDCGTAVCGCVARDGCRIVAEAIPDHPDPRTDLVAGYGVRAYACHPLVVEGETIGTLSFGTTSRDTFTADDLATMKAIADLIAIAMQRIADREALRRQSEELEAVMDLVPAAIWVGHDPGCTLITGNRAANEFYEAEPGENVSADVPSSPRTFFSSDGRRLDAEELPMQVAAARNLAVPNAEFEVELPSGRRRHLLGSAVPLREAGGAVRGAVAAFLDITPRKEAEAELALFAERLQRSNEELQRFAYVASHDLQEPLRSIVSFSQLLERRYKGKLDQDADDYIGFIVDGGVRMQALIRDLLQVSRLETAAKPPEPTEAGTVARDALALLNGQIRDLGGSVTVGSLPTVMADAAQLEQVFVNLIGNAVKYRRPGVPPEIRIGAVRVGPMVEFSVADNGIGIEEEYYDRIFEMFRRLHTHDKYEGTGIGLAVVKRIVERHGGIIRVESTPGEGSTFFFTLPAA